MGPVCERRGQVRERDGKKGSKPGRMVRAPEGCTAVPGMKREGGGARRGRNGGEERDERGGATARRARDAVGGWKREVLGINGRNPAGHYTLLDTT